MSEVKAEENKEEYNDILTESQLYEYGYEHMWLWGYLRPEGKTLWFSTPDSRVEILKYFGFPYFSEGCGDSHWRKNFKEMELWTNKQEFVAWMTGQSFIDEKIAEALRSKIKKAVTALGAWYAVYDALGFKTINETRALQLLREFNDRIDLSYELQTVRDYRNWFGEHKPRNDTLVTFAIEQGNAEFIELVLDIVQITDLNTQKLLDFARQQGQWHIYQKLELAIMGRTVFERVEREGIKIERTGAVVEEFMRDYPKEKRRKDTKTVMQGIVDRVIRAIENQKPLSDELLLIAFNWSCQQAKTVLQCKVWQALARTCLDVLQIPLDKATWRWFELYLLGSSIWYQKAGDGRILYDELVDLVQTQWYQFLPLSFISLAVFGEIE